MIDPMNAKALRLLEFHKLRQRLADGAAGLAHGLGRTSPGADACPWSWSHRRTSAKSGPARP